MPSRGGSRHPSLLFTIVVAAAVNIGCCCHDLQTHKLKFASRTRLFKIRLLCIFATVEDTKRCTNAKKNFRIFPHTIFAFSKQIMHARQHEIHQNSSQRARNWAFTLFDFSREDIAALSTPNARIQYLCFSEETCPDSGRAHLQGYVSFKNPWRLQGIRAFFHEWIRDTCNPHLEAAKGSYAQNRAYIEGPWTSKDGKKEKPLNETFIDWGTPPVGQGKRTDLDLVTDAIHAGASEYEIAVNYSSQYVKFHGGIQKLLAKVSPPRDFKTKVFWLWGPTGAGKTRFVMDNWQDVYVKNPENKWWDGYHGQETVLMDDFRFCKEIPLTVILRLFDRYPMTVEVKCGTTNFCPKRIFLTSPSSLNQMLSKTCYEWIGEENTAQITRRITAEWEFPLAGSILNYVQLVDEEEAQ